MYWLCYIYNSLVYSILYLIRLSLLDLQQRECVLTWALQSLTLLMNRNSTSASGRSFADGLLRRPRCSSIYQCSEVPALPKNLLNAPSFSQTEPQCRSAMEATVQVCHGFSIKIIKSIPPKWQIRGVPGSKPWICPSLRDEEPAHCHRWAERCILAEGTNELLHPRYKKSLVDFLWLIVNYHRINGLFIGIIHRDLFIDYYQKHN